MMQTSLSSRRTSSRRDSSGAVLLLVLCAVAILTVLAVEVAHRARLDVQRGQRLAQDLCIKRAFDSGIQTARGLIVESRKNPAFDYFGDGWCKPVSLTLEDGTALHVQIYDESGKLNLLQLKSQPGISDNSDRTIARLFKYLIIHDTLHSDQWKDVETQVRRRVGIVAVNDKSDPKTVSGVAPTPLLTLDGLREAGVPTALIYGRAQVAGESHTLALCDVMTTFGDGLINLNTADESVLYSLATEYDDSVVNSISTWRGVRSDDSLGDFRAFQLPSDLEQVKGIVRKSSGTDPSIPDENLFAKVKERVSVHSACFSAKIDIVLGTQQRSGWVFFEVSRQDAGDLSPGDLKVLAFEEIEP